MKSLKPFWSAATLQFLEASTVRVSLADTVEPYPVEAFVLDHAPCLLADAGAVMFHLSRAGEDVAVCGRCGVSSTVAGPAPDDEAAGDRFVQTVMCRHPRLFMLPDGIPDLGSLETFLERFSACVRLAIRS